MAHHATPLKFLFPGWFAVVMGLCGLSLAWHRATPLMGEVAHGAALAIGALAAVVFVALALASVARMRHHADAWRDDCLHPVRHAFVAMLPIALLLLATVAVALDGPSWPARAAWWAGSLMQFAVTVWVLARWWRGNLPAQRGDGPQRAPGLLWVGVTPVLFVPVVGNVLAPLAGMPLGHAGWASAQFGVGLMLWPVVLVLVIVRLAVQGAWPERLRPANFIVIAPPAVVGLVALQLDAPVPLGWMLWGMAVFGLAWAGTQARLIASQPFALPHWAVSFPLAALAALTLRLAEPGGAMAVLGPVLLALASIVVAALLLATVRGLRDGSLLQPEPVASIAAAS